MSIYKKLFLLLVIVVCVYLFLSYGPVSKPWLGASYLNARGDAAFFYHYYIAKTNGTHASLPRSCAGLFSNSTEYFRFVLERYPCECPRDLSSLSSSDNIWCVVLDIDPSDDERTPVFFTGNLEIHRLDEACADLVNQDSRMFSERKILVLRKNETVDFLDPADISAKFNPSGAANLVLRPQGVK